MTIREVICSAARLPALGVLFLLLTGQMALAVAAFRDGRSRRVRFLLLAPFVLGAVVFWLCLSVISWDNNFPDRRPAPPEWLAAFSDCPVWVMASFETLAAAALGIAPGGVYEIGPLWKNVDAALINGICADCEWAYICANERNETI